MMISPTLKPASLADAPLLAQLHQAHFKRGWSASEFASFFEKGGVIASLAYVEDAPAGFIFCWAAALQCELLCLAVEERFRRRRIARALCESALKDCAGLGIEALHLEVAISNQGALRLYEQLGFTLQHRRKNYYRYPDGRCEDALTMRRNIIVNPETSVACYSS